MPITPIATPVSAGKRAPQDPIAATTDAVDNSHKKHREGAKPAEDAKAGSDLLDDTPAAKDTSDECGCTTGSDTPPPPPPPPLDTAVQDALASASIPQTKGPKSGTVPGSKKGKAGGKAQHGTKQRHGHHGAADQAAKGAKHAAKGDSKSGSVSQKADK